MTGEGREPRPGMVPRTPAGLPRRHAPERILLIRLSALGDVLVTLPLLRRLREELPGTRIDFAVQDELAPLLLGHPDLDGVVSIPVRALGRLLARPWRWPEALSRLGALRRRLAGPGYDCVLDAHGNLKSALVARLSGAPRILGPAPGEGREGNALWTTERPRRPASTRRHRSERALALLSPLGFEPRWAAPRLPAFPSDWADRALAAAHGEGPPVLLHPGTSPRAPHKRWPAERFGALAARLAGAGARVLVVGGPGEDDLVAEAVAASRGTAGALPRPPGLPELGALVARARLFVGADSGPAHLAEACGIPTLALFGPKDPTLYGPRRGLSVRVDVPCGPCGLRRCPLPRLACMEDLSLEAVAAAAVGMLEGSLPKAVGRQGPVRILVEPARRRE